MKLVLLSLVAMIATSTFAEIPILQFTCKDFDPLDAMTVTHANGTVSKYTIICQDERRMTPLDFEDVIELGNMPVYEYYLPRFVPKSMTVVDEEAEANAVVQSYTKILENAMADINERIDKSDPWFVQYKRIAEQLQKDIELRQQMDRWLNEMRYVRPMPRLYRHVEIAHRNYKMARNLSSVHRDEMCHKTRRRILLHECME